MPGTRGDSETDSKVIDETENNQLQKDPSPSSSALGKQPESAPPVGGDPARNAESHRPSQDGTDKHAEFCAKLGIIYDVRIPGNKNQPAHLSRATAPEVVRHGYYFEILRAYAIHNTQYWLLESLINMLYLSQIAIGATATALGSVGVANATTRGHTTAITILTTIGTIIAGVLAFLKSRGQPNRACQTRNDMRKVCDYVRYMEMEYFYQPTTETSVDDALKEVKRLYDLARSNAETNDPDTWSTSADTRKTQIFVNPGGHPVGEVNPGGKVSKLVARVV